MPNANPNAPMRLMHATAATPGAIAIVQLIGDRCEAILRDLTGERDWPVGRLRLTDFDGIDTGLALRLTERIAQIMPHGGPRVVQRLTARLVELGAAIAPVDEVDARDAFPEAIDDVEALMLQAMARAASPLAIDILAAQPARWRERLGRAGASDPRGLSDADVARAQRLNRLISPPILALAGEANVGKSTLSNALIGRAMSIAADVPGTTRDYVAGRIDLDGLVVDWHDTPGLRRDADSVERQAIDVAQPLMERADFLVAMRDGEHEWPALPRAADFYVINKVDDAAEAEEMAPDSAGDDAARALRISAKTGRGLASLTRRLRERLVPHADLANPGPWLFDLRLARTPSQC